MRLAVIFVLIGLEGAALARPKVEWRDLDGDGVKEKVQGSRVWQERFGAWLEVGMEVARCGSAGGGRQAAIDAFVAGVEAGTDEASLRCLYGDALAAAGIAPVDAPWPDRGATMTIAPIATDCPASGWAARHGRAIAARRSIVFASAGGLARVEVDGARMHVARADLVPIAALRDVHAARASRVDWSEAWVLDEHLWVAAQIAVEGDGGAKAKYVVVYDPDTGLLNAGERVKGREEAKVQIGVEEPGAFEVVIAGPDGERVVWRRDVETWNP